MALNDGKPISFIRCDWADEEHELGKFDLIIGSDLLYELDHPQLLSSFIDRHAKPNCEVIIVDPGRSQRAAFTKKMIAMNYSYSDTKPENIDYLADLFKGKILKYIRQAD